VGCVGGDEWSLFMDNSPAPNGYLRSKGPSAIVIGTVMPSGPGGSSKWAATEQPALSSGCTHQIILVCVCMV
jgi:hypothetical protein